MKYSLTPRPLDVQAKDALIVFVQNKKPLLSGSKTICALVEKQIKHSGFDGETQQTSVFPTFGKTKPGRIVLAGLGKSADFRMEQLERAAAAAIRAGQKAGAKSFVTATDIYLSHVTEPAFIHAVARGAGWGTYDFNTFKTKPKKKPEASLTFAGDCKNAAAGRRALADAQAESDALLSTADLANLPGNIATPQKIANWAQKMAKETGLTCSVLNKTDLKKQNCNALLAVAGSNLDAKIITLKYKGTDPKAKPVVLVGKTITFDSGGISLKPGKGMGWMLYDKCGGMAVLAAMKMVALLKPKSPVVGILTVAENMPGSGATRPGDIIKSRAGKTIEILNTDAEGRLALCDALDLALKHKPAAIVDLATLTGAVIVALGHSASAVMGNNSRLTQKLIKAAEAGGERLWELPLWQEHKDDMKGTFADLQNIGKSGTAGTITAGAFLSEFVPDDIPWAHIDIAGTAWIETPKPWMDPGATLFGARTLIEWIKGMN
ncbi:MAG: leucyl aminopeptidase [Kiritimatiellales bacterium]|nr:leucyl aminopeptidase [Kiritimatiellota bacterium]MBL7012619.1 leucyl aminopeptidase [Kiritimatiellales bacterium]